MRLPQIHDGPAPLAVRGHIPRGLSTLNSQTLNCPLWQSVTHEKGGGASTSQTQTTATTDNRVAVDGDGNQIYHGNEIGGSLVFNTLADDVALGALNTAEELGRRGLNTSVDLTQIGADTTVSLAAGALAALERLVDSNEAVTNRALGSAQKTADAGLATASSALAGANASADRVADAQSKFLSTQTGQTTAQKVVLYGVAGAAVIGLGLAAMAVSKSKK